MATSNGECSNSAVESMACPHIIACPSSAHVKAIPQQVADAMEGCCWQSSLGGGSWKRGPALLLLSSWRVLLFCVGAALLAPAKPPARPPEARPPPGRRRQRGGRGGLPPAHPLPPFVPVPSSLRLVKARPRPGRRRQRGGRGGLPPAHFLSSSVLVENGWWLSSCLVVRPSASAQGAATQALQRRHSGALCRAKSIHGVLVYV